MESLTQRPVTLRYLMALVAPALMAGVMQITWPLFEASPIALFLLAVMFSGWYGGLGPGLASLLVSILLVDYLFLYPYFSLGPQNRNDLIRLLVLTTTGLFTSLLSGLTHKEKHRAEISLDAVQKAEQKYRDIFDNALEGIFRTSPEGRFLVANPALAVMFGFDNTEDLVSERADISKQHYVDPKRREEFKRLMEEAGTVSQFEYEAYRKDGSKIWVSDNVRVIRNEDGKIVCYEGIAKDITERKRADTRRAAFAALAGKLSGARVPLNAAQTIADTAQELFGWESCALKLYDADQDLIHPLLYIDTVAGQLTNVTPASGGTKPAPKSRLVIERGAQLILRETPYEFDEDSEPFGDIDRPSASVMTVPIRHSTKTIGIMSIQSYRPHAYDQEALTDLQALADHCGAALNRIWAEEALRTQKEVLQTIFDHIPAMISFFDSDGRIKLVNPEWERWRGWSAEEIQRAGVDLLAEGYPDQEYRQKVIALAAKLNGQPFELKTKVRDGRILETVWSVIHLSDGTRIGLGQDVTERNRTENALRESEERYRELFENAKDATYVHDLSGRYTSVNRAAERLSGRTREEIIGRRFTDFVPPEQVEAINDHLCRKLVEQGETTYETEVIARDGRHIPVEVSSHMIYQNGVGVGVQGTARDITERKRAEDLLRQAKEFSESLIQTANVIILGLDTEGNINIFNQTAEEITGYTAAELKGRSWFELLAPRERYPQLHAEFQRLVLSGLPKTFENRILTKSGEERQIMWQNSRVVVDGKVVATISFGNDITERKQGEEALRQSEERFSKAFHSSPASLSIALLGDGSLLEVNAAFLRMTGYSREDVIGRSTVDLGLWANPDDRLLMTEKLRDGRMIDSLEFKFRKKSGEVRNGLLSCELIELGTEPCVLGIALDTTERIRAEDALQSYPRRLIAAQETERQNIARELHDQIGQVLTAIRINLQTVLETPKVSNSRALIDEGVAMVDEALAQVRDLSFELRPSLLDDLGLVAALRWYCDRFSHRTGIRAINTIDLPEGTRLNVDLETACFRIAQEALTNVARHAAARNVSITLRNSKNEICLAIKDDGQGFGAPSQDVSQLTTHLGLRSMRERALALDGRLEINSSQSRGTEITAYFPRSEKEE